MKNQKFSRLSVLLEPVPELMSIWEMVGEMEVNFMDVPLPIGQYALILGLVLKGQIILKIFGFSYFILRFNHELAKAGFFE